MRFGQAFEPNLTVLPLEKLRKLYLRCRNHRTSLFLPHKDILEPGAALRAAYLADIHSADPLGKELTSPFKSLSGDLGSISRPLAPRTGATGLQNPKLGCKNPEMAGEIVVQIFLYFVSAYL